MRLAQCHLSFYLDKKAIPAWGRQMQAEQQAKSYLPKTPDLLIDACVNAHADLPKRTQSACDMGNMVRFVGNRQRRSEPILPFLQNLVHSPGTTINPQRRSAIARRWAKRILKSRRK